jgi:serine/threonine-protein kinase
LTGAHTQAFSLEKEEMLRQLAEEPPLSFASHGAPNVPNTERTLQRALAKDPSDRFGSVEELFHAFHSAVLEDGKTATPVASTEIKNRLGDSLLNDVLARLAVSGPLSRAGLPAPTASVMNGAAGLAYALLRIAMIRDDEHLLAAADLWSTKALLATEPNSFWNPQLEITKEIFGERSLYHTVAGVHCVEALLAHARADGITQQAAIDAFIDAAGEPCSHVDVAFGKAGLLLGCALLAEAVAPPQAPQMNRLRSLADDLAGSICGMIAREPSVAESAELTYLGVAHGWAGVLYALLRWSEAFGTELSAMVFERLAQLGSLSHPWGRGLVWPRELRTGLTQNGLAASWCNGGAGFVHLWTLAHRHSGDNSYAKLAEMASWTAYEGPDAGGDLCCGLAGRAYALLAMYKYSGERHWLLRARHLADRAAASIKSVAVSTNSLYKGEIGVALLFAELQSPEQACMPMFEAEAWQAVP